MSIKEARKRASSESKKAEIPGSGVVPETAICDFIKNLGIHDIGVVAARFQIVADVTSVAVNDRVDQLDSSDLHLIKQLARESNAKHYRRIMRAIIAGVSQGQQGINAAHLTANRTAEMAFRWTPDYFSALRQYRDKLRSNRQPVRAK